ncbi:ArsR/SmtB family transcription factor [Thalassorhabdomicrobium marinisediminis]|uniref:ArsR family transcriptional regulator n=1 Tax=Thalassorhabdomicrobium marinisediminis TaxID=2170577 RepID=A0A2T7FSY1_9RHOB|nr:metalloregulator ArsR/SmtB family transcription factor [Thalassorhabdomicrobium marinisediminis]PVA05281.1 ArsR family transcriptional regulator [Thalassorhabdomicrobium marinisediminis]
MKVSDDFIKDNIKDAAALMEMLSSESRLQILCRLTNGERSVGELARMCDLPQPTMSQQLKRLKEAGLVEGRRAGQTIYYSIKGDEVGAVLNTLYGLFCAAGPITPDGEPIASAKA